MALQNVKGTLPHRFTLAFLHEELLDEGPAAQKAGGLEIFQDMPAWDLELRRSSIGSRFFARQGHNCLTIFAALRIFAAC